MFKKVFFWYQKLMWYVSQTRNEIGKPLGLYSEFGMLLLLLGMYSMKIKPLHAIIIYAGILLLAGGVGILLVLFGVVKYNNKLSNVQNPEIMELLERVKNIEEKVSVRWES